MTEKEFGAFLKTLTDFTDSQYACEAWQSMTKEEKAKCTPEQINGYIEDTYLSIEETEE